MSYLILLRGQSWALGGVAEAFIHRVWTCLLSALTLVWLRSVLGKILDVQLKRWHKRHYFSGSIQVVLFTSEVLIQMESSQELDNLARVSKFSRYPQLSECISITQGAISDNRT